MLNIFLGKNGSKERTEWHYPIGSPSKRETSGVRKLVGVLGALAKGNSVELQVIENHATK